MSSKEECPTPKEHNLHMCSMKQKGLMEEIDKASANPTVICNRCGAKADDESYLCNPRPL